VCVCAVLGSTRAAVAPACTKICPVGQHCESHTVQCFRAPCPPQQTCVQDAPSGGVQCGDVQCAPNQTCETVYCFAAPCNPVCTDAA